MRAGRFLNVAAGFGVVIAFGATDLAGTGTTGQERSESQMLIEPAELERRLDEPNLRILDTRSADEYAAGHVPGAIRVDVAKWQNLARAEGGLHDARAWAEIVGGLGIERDSHVVVYGSKLPNTGRIWWMLKYLGVPDVAVLNGGWAAWVREERPTDTAVPEITATDFKPQFDADRLEEINSLKKSVARGDVRVVDTRSEDEYTGKDVRGARGGHIAGATHLEWKELLADDGRFKSRDELKKLFRERGILPGETAVCY